MGGLLRQTKTAQEYTTLKSKVSPKKALPRMFLRLNVNHPIPVTQLNFLGIKNRLWRDLF